MHTESCPVDVDKSCGNVVDATLAPLVGGGAYLLFRGPGEKSSTVEKKVQVNFEMEMNLQVE